MFQIYDIVEDSQLGDDIINKIIDDNPHLRRGSDIMSSNSFAKDGKVYSGSALRSVLNFSAYTKLEMKVIKIFLPLNSSSSMTDDLFKQKKFIHFIRCDKNTPTYKVGDIIKTLNPETQMVTNTEVTQKMFELNQFAMLRFALS